jgi:hypothetical protein
MRFLLFSFVILFAGCKSEYGTMSAITPDDACMDRLRPVFKGATWYDTSIGVYGKHFSGLLLIKETGVDTFRTVFTNETGATLFDFEFTGNGGFNIKRVIKQMDRKPVTSTLRDDLSLLLGQAFRKSPAKVMQRGDENFYLFPQKRDIAYFITDKDCASLRRLEMGSKRKRKTSITFEGFADHIKAATIEHHTFDMTIKLIRIER